MLIDNLTTTSFSLAVQRTFDGNHPCALCKAIDEGKKSERKSDTLVPLKKFEGINAGVAIVFFPSASFPTITTQAAFLDTHLHAPPTPPPRSA